MTVLGARQLSKAFGGAALFEDVALTVRDGERVGLLGANGTGKSTLLKVLAGREPADGGVVDRRRDARILYVAQEPEIDLDATARTIVSEGLADLHAAMDRHATVTRALATETATARTERETTELVAEQARLAETVEHLGGWSREHLVDAVLGKLGVPESARDRPARTLSGGERRRVALARVLVAEPDLAILDEPTNHLDADTIAWLEEHLANTFRGAVLMVTHDRYVLDAVCDRILELDGGRVTEFSGGYADYLEQKQILLEHAGRAESNRLNLLRRERAWLLRGAKARSTKQKARIQRAEALVAQGPLQETDRVVLGGLEAVAPRTGRTILELRSLRVEIAGAPLVRDLTMHLTSGERVGIVGPNGAGKTSLLRVVTGALEPASGSVVIGKQTRVVLFDQAREQLEDDWSVFDNVAGRKGAEASGGGLVVIGDRTVELRTYLEHFLFDGRKQRQMVGALSGGERARVALAKVLRSGANVLLLDEPTNDLDLPTLGALEELLVAWPGCVLVVSHDRWFLNRVATGILAFEGDGRVVKYEGDYDSWKATSASTAAAGTGTGASSGAKPNTSGAAGVTSTPSATSPALRPLTYAERIELDGLLDHVAEAEATVARLEAALAAPARYADPGVADGLRALRTDLSSAQGEVARLTARWEDLESRRDVKRQ